VPARRYPSLVERILANTYLCDESFYDGSPCWVWLGNRCPHGGYGRITIREGGRHRKVRVIRVVLKEFRGIELAADEMVLHGCNNPPCCNPMHLRPGSGAENARQRWAEGRTNWQQAAA